MIDIKSSEEQELMRQGGLILSKILNELKEKVVPGISSLEIDNLANRLCLKYRVKPSFKGYNGYPNSVCITTDDAVVHGLASDKPFREGELVTLDMGVFHQGFHTDSAVSFVCGDSSNYQKDLRLIKVCEQSFYSAVDLIKEGVHLGDVSAKIQEVAEASGYGVIRMLVGHGIGRNVHEEPNIPNYGIPGTGQILKTGMTLAIEPMLTQDGSVDVVLDDDGWTYRSKTGAKTVHFEHTVLVLDNGFEILTANDL